MLRSMYSGVSGLKNHQIRMDAIGNNIANVNTIGYKGSRVTFQDTLNQTMRGASAPNGSRGGINAVQVGLGMNLSSIDILNTQGNRQNTGNTTDLMIDGDGFFVVSDGGRQYYTRAGNFNLERDGRLVCASNGMIVQGWLADARGSISTNTQITNITIPLGRSIAPLATTEIGFEKNLNADTNAYYAFKGGTINIQDVNGNTVSVNCKLTRIPDSFNQFYYDLRPAGSDTKDTSDDDTSYSISSGTGKGTVRLDQYGNVLSIFPDTYITIQPKNGDPIRLQMPVAGTSFGSFFTANPPNTPVTQQVILNVASEVSPAPGPYDFGEVNQERFQMQVLDQRGNPINLQYDVTNLGDNRYRWTATVLSGGEILSGPSGTFTWTGANGVTDPSGGYLVIQSSAGNQIHIAPPGLGGSTDPTFNVVEYEPTEMDYTFDPAGGFPQIDHHVFTASDGSTVDVQMTINDLGGDSYQWTAAILPATPGCSFVTGTTTTGTFTYTAGAPDTITQSIQANISIRTATGYEVTLSPPVNTDNFAPVPANTIAFFQTSGTSLIPQFLIPPDVVTTSKVYDSLGAEHVITIRAEKTGTNIWSWEATEGSGLPITNGRGTLTFDSRTGFVTNSPGGPMTFQPIGADMLRITPDFSKVTQGYGPHDDSDYKWAISDFDAPNQDGYPLGTLQGINIDRAGRIIGVFSNGMNQNLGQVAMANFTNPGGLSRAGDTLFEESSNSGTARIGQAGTGGRGLVTPGAVEMANVDLSEQFTDMITTERGFQANSRIITTSDEMLQELVNLKR